MQVEAALKHAEGRLAAASGRTVNILASTGTLDGMSHSITHYQCSTYDGHRPNSMQLMWKRTNPSGFLGLGTALSQYGRISPDKACALQDVGLVSIFRTVMIPRGARNRTPARRQCRSDDGGATVL